MAEYETQEFKEFFQTEFKEEIKMANHVVCSHMQNMAAALSVIDIPKVSALDIVHTFAMTVFLVELRVKGLRESEIKGIMFEKFDDALKKSKEYLEYTVEKMDKKNG